MKPPIKISGVVKRRLGRGRELGFPTANLDVDADQYAEGVYFGYTNFAGRHLPSLVFIGSARTFGDEERFVETYILGYRGILYGEIVELEVLEKLRDNQKFDTKEELVAQMQLDELKAREFFAEMSSRT